VPQALPVPLVPPAHQAQSQDSVSPAMVPVPWQRVPSQPQAQEPHQPPEPSPAPQSQASSRSPLEASQDSSPYLGQA
jgi:hypothetical protein